MNHSFLKSKWSIFIVTSMANLGVSFAINSLNLALPLIREEFGVSQSDVSWLALVYSLLPSCMLLLFGRLAGYLWVSETIHLWLWFFYCRFHAGANAVF